MSFTSLTFCGADDFVALRFSDLRHSRSSSTRLDCESVGYHCGCLDAERVFVDLGSRRAIVHTNLVVVLVRHWGVSAIKPYCRYIFGPIYAVRFYYFCKYFHDILSVENTLPNLIRT